MLIGAFNLPALIDTWWPVLLILLALALLVLAIIRRPKASLVAPSKTPPAKSYDTPPPARGASVTSMPASSPAPAPKAAPASEPEIDIYKLIEQQPKDPKT
jgi:hypothetical protein